MSEVCRAEIFTASEPRIPVSEVIGDSHRINWFVADFETAWNCALDVEAWLKVRYAGNGTITQISGQASRIGVGYLHSAPGAFGLYYLDKIDHEGLKLTFRVQTDLGSLRASNGERTCTLQISQVPRASGLYQVQLSEDCCTKKWAKHHRQAHVLKQFEAISLALGTHFQKYTQRECDADAIIALPVE